MTLTTMKHSTKSQRDWHGAIVVALQQSTYAFLSSYPAFLAALFQNYASHLTIRSAPGLLVSFPYSRQNCISQAAAVHVPLWWLNGSIRLTGMSPNSVSTTVIRRMQQAHLPAASSLAAASDKYWPNEISRTKSIRVGTK